MARSEVTLGTPAPEETGFVGAKKAPKRRRNWRETLAGYLFIAPGLIHSLVFIVLVIFVSASISLTQWNLISPPDFIGFENYQRLFDDSVFWITLKNTVIYVLLSVPTSIGLALALALAANTKLKGVTFFRTAYFFPYVATLISVAIVFRWLYNSDYGLLNSFLGFFGINPVDWLGQCNTAMPAVALMSVWKGLGWNMTLFLAGLQGIPGHLYEAAAIDGAGRWRQFRDITWPLLSPTTFFVAITSMLGAFAVFDSVFILTGGGPERCTTFYMLYVYRQGFEFFNMGYAASLAWVLFGILLIATFIQFKILNKRIHYELG